MPKNRPKEVILHLGDTETTEVSKRVSEVYADIIAERVGKFDLNKETVLMLSEEAKQRRSIFLP